MLLLSSLRVAREVEKQACLSRLMDKKRYLSGLRAEVQERTCAYSPGFFRPRQDRLTLVAILYPYISLTVVTLFFAAAVRELGIKGPEQGGKVVEGRGFESAPQRLLQLERETTARTGSRAEGENCGECVK